MSWVGKPGVTHQCMIFISVKKKHEESSITFHFPHFNGIFLLSVPSLITWVTLKLFFSVALTFSWTCPYPRVIQLLSLDLLDYSKLSCIHPCRTTQTVVNVSPQNSVQPEHEASGPRTSPSWRFPKPCFLEGRENKKCYIVLYCLGDILHFCRQSCTIKHLHGFCLTR